MKGFIKQCCKYRSELVIAGICLACFIIRLILGYTHYEINDDMHMNLIAAGAYSADSQYLIFCNILYGYFLKILYHLIPGVNWYLWVFLLSSLLGITALCMVLSGGRDVPLSGAVITAFLINWLLGEQFYNSIQWTKNASFYAILLFIFLLCFLKNGKRRYLLLALLYCFLSIGIRDSCFTMVLPFGMLFVAGFQLAAGDGIRKTILRTLIVAAGLFLIYLSMSGIQKYAYGQDGWKEFRAYTLARASVLDYGTIEEMGEKHEGELSEIGVCREDIDMLKRSLFDDPDFFTTDRLRAISKTIRSGESAHKTSAFLAGEVLGQVAHRTLMFRICMIFWGILLAVLIFSQNVIFKLLSLGTALGILGEYYCLARIARMVWRVEYGIWLAAVLLLSGTFVLLYGMKWDRRKLNMILLIFASLLVLRDAYRLFSVFSTEKQYSIAGREGTHYEFFSEIKDDSIFYLGDGYVFMAGEWAKNIYDIDRSYEGYFSRFSSLGDWDTGSPPVVEKLAFAGIPNPIRALAEHGDVRLASDEEGAGVVLRYLRAHYDPEIEVVKRESIGGVEIWQFSAGHN